MKIRITDEARALCKADGEMERAVAALDGTEYEDNLAAILAVESAVRGETTTRVTAYSVCLFARAWQRETGATHAVCELV